VRTNKNLSPQGLPTAIEKLCLDNSKLIV